MKLHHLTLLSIVALSTAGPFLAGKALAQDSDPILHYEVEIVLYKNTKVPKSKEYILPVSSPTKDDVTIDFSQPSGIEAAKEREYEVVLEPALRLTDTANKITRSSRYEVVTHFAWRQPGLDKSQVLPIWIKAGRRYGNEFISIDDQIELLKANQAVDDVNPLKSIDVAQNSLEELGLTNAAAPLNEAKTSGLYEVEGKITVALSRYLHVYTDLVLRKPRRSLDPQLNLQLETASSDPLLYENLADARILDNHLFKEHRRMRSETLHYLDSPELSMLILITPYEVPVATQSSVSPAKGLTTKVTVSD
ncbi:MAG: hypothetical protein ACI823_000438 [Chitinophagales bacterium]|jgi:hypothetical protein